MDITTGAIIIAAFYLWFLFMDLFFKSCSHYAYLEFLKGTGLEVKLFQFKWTTTAFNKVLLRWGSRRSTFLKIWFNFGLFISLLLLPTAIYLLLIAFCDNFGNRDPTKGSILEPVLPGVNLPASEIGYYSITLLISSIIHELGHAVAATQEDVTVLSVGANVVFVLPVAYVHLNSDKLFSLNPWKRLKILCAGVWHNLFVAFLAYLLYIAVPSAMAPFYDINSGVIVSRVLDKSVISGTKGLHSGDKIVQINDCKVSNESGWYDCLRSLQANKPAFCIAADVVHTLDESVNLKHTENGIVTCCHSANAGKLCFEYLDSKDSILEFPPYVCLPGRTVTEGSRSFCSVHPFNCPQDTACFRPVLANNTNLYKIKRDNQFDVIYLGPLSDLFTLITVSSYVPNYRFLSNAIPDVSSKFFSYVAVFSMGLAIVNILPVLFMDGQHITNTLCHILCSSRLRTSHIKIISAIITVSFTFLLIVHCLIVTWRLFT